MRHRLHGLLLAGALALIASPIFAADLDDAIAAYQRGEHATAIPALTAAAEAGDPLAQVYLGLAYYNGHGVVENDIVAFTWFWRAAEQGDAEGQYQLAYMYTYGFGIPEGEPDPGGKAVEWFTQAAEQGHAEAQFNLGLLLLAGSGIDRDEETGLRWIETAAANGSEGARRFTGEIN